MFINFISSVFFSMFLIFHFCLCLFLFILFHFSLFFLTFCIFSRVLFSLLVSMTYIWNKQKIEKTKIDWPNYFCFKRRWNANVSLLLCFLFFFLESFSSLVLFFFMWNNSNQLNQLFFLSNHPHLFSIRRKNNFPQIRKIQAAKISGSQNTVELRNHRLRRGHKMSFKVENLLKIAYFIHYFNNFQQK